ncbi:MAG: hypothetical protein QF441_11350 [Bacteriovoracaceae bacterium]|jgi:superfamily II helicase|nr:hypothetical protein [Bacteriovoracaceae bacterium]|tara:strand:+ start:63 stop:545 length:483 start_codon:yes stop_codon:yes gene_type:complete
MSLKDALLKAGFKSSKIENERQRKLSKEKTKTEKHQERRNFCEVCECTQPDVERFKHKNPRIDAQWICSNCADKNEILDDFRVTAQSEFSTSGRYRRYYGHTRDLSKESPVVKDNRKKTKYKHERNGYRNPGNQKRHAAGKKRTSRRYKIDENGEKNFNC